MGTLVDGAVAELRREHYELLPGCARALLQVVLRHGGQLDAGYASLANALGRSVRTVELTIPRLVSSGWLETKRRRRRPAVLRLSGEARRVLALQHHDRGSGGVALRPQGFLGNVAALHEARILVRLKHTATAKDFAELYLEHAGGEEVARIQSLCDDDGYLAMEQCVTGDEHLDLGLHDYFESLARRKTSRARFRSFMGFDAEE